MTRVDLHAHVLPAAYVERLPPELAAVHRLVPVEALEKFMVRYRIDAAVVSVGNPGVYFGDAGQARALARVVNEDLAATISRAPARFAALACLPLPDVEGGLAELDYALDTLGLDGVIVATQVGGTYLGDPAWDPVLAELDRRSAYVFVHPSVPPNGQPLPHFPAWLYEFPFETTRVITNLIYGGAFERHPRIRWQFAHLGGAISSLAHRIASLADREPERAAGAPAGALAYLSRQYYDTGLSNHEAPIAAALLLAPFERLVFGTDWPYLALPEGDDPAPGLAYLGAERRAKLEAEHARVLIPRLFAQRT